MKVILLEDVKTLGKKGEIVEVNDGYARNFVLPKKLGLEASTKNLNDLRLKKAHDEKLAAEQLEQAKQLAVKLAELEVIVHIKAGEGGRTFGSVSSKEVARAAQEQHGIELDKKKIVLQEAIKNFGAYEVAVKLHPQVTGTLKVSNSLRLVCIIYLLITEELMNTDLWGLIGKTSLIVITPSPIKTTLKKLLILKEFVL